MSSLAAYSPTNKGVMERCAKRWYKLRYHPEQARMIESDARFKVCHSGRRCLEEGTDVSTPNGPMPIEKLKIGDEVIGYNEHGDPEVTKVINTWDNGEQLVYPLYAWNEKILAATADHRLWCCDNYHHNKSIKPEIREKYGYRKVKISDMWYKSRVKKAYSYDLIDGGDKHIKHAYILGALLGDGCCSKDEKFVNKKNIKSITISSEDAVIPTYIYKELNGYKLWTKENNYDWFIKCNESIYDLIPYYAEWCSGKRAHQKIADWEEINTWDKESCLAFLAGIIDTDGCFKYGDHGQLLLNIGMQAESVIDCCYNIIYKYFQDKAKRFIDNRDKYVNGPLHVINTTNHLATIRIYSNILPYLQKKNNFNTSKKIVSGVLEDRIYLKKNGESYLAKTYDITIGNKTNLYILHNKAIIQSNSGKSELLGKRVFLEKAIKGVPYSDPRYFIAAPTRDQVKRIYWHDIKLMTRPFWLKEPSESNLIVFLNTGPEVHLVGMDKPERIEGSHWDGGVLDEYGNMKGGAWLENIRPALATPNRPPGWCYFVGVPEGRNHYYDLCNDAKRTDKIDWDVFHWPSSDILDPKEIESAKRDMDELTFRQEMCGEFVSFAGRAYYNFDRDTHVKPLNYDPARDLFLCFDFNISPGICNAIQEFDNPQTGKVESHVIDEIHIKGNSNTIIVSKKIAEKYKNHNSRVVLYGDASGGAGGSAQILGSDWELVRKTLYPYFSQNLYTDIPKKNPKERERVNAVNSRFMSTNGIISMYVDPNCSYTIKDFEGVSTVDSSGQIDKKNLELTHHSDAVGYNIQRRWPIKKYESGTVNIIGI